MKAIISLPRHVSRLAVLQAKTLAKYASEDAADLDAFALRSKEPSESFDSFVQGMKRRGVIKY